MNHDVKIDIVPTVVLLALVGFLFREIDSFGITLVLGVYSFALCVSLLAHLCGLSYAKAPRFTRLGT